MVKGKSGKRVLSAPRMESERAGAKSRKRFGEAFAETAGAPAAEHEPFSSAVASRVAILLSGAHLPKRRSDGGTPWQFALGDYEVRFSEKTPRGTARRDGGSWGIYLRDWNVRVATFTADSAALRKALAHMFDAAHVLTESVKKAVEIQTKGNHGRHRS